MLLLVNCCWFILACLFWQRTKKAAKEGHVRLMSPPAPIGSLALLKWVLLLQSSSISFRFAVQQAPNSTGDWSNSRCLQKTKRKHFVQTWAHPSAPPQPPHCPPLSFIFLFSPCLRSLLPRKPSIKKKKKRSQSIQAASFHNPSPPTISPRLMTRPDKT